MSTLAPASIATVLAEIFPFNQLSQTALTKIAANCQYWRYRIGQTLVSRESMPDRVVILQSGFVRLLGYDQRLQQPVSLDVIGTGALLGAQSLLRGLPCEIAIASTEVIAVTLAAADFLALVQTEAIVAAPFAASTCISEVFELLSVEFQRQADGSTDLKALAHRVWRQAVVVKLGRGKANLSQLDPQLTWFVSAGTIGHQAAGDRLDLSTPLQRVEGAAGVRLLGIPTALDSEKLHDSEKLPSLEKPAIVRPTPAILDAPDPDPVAADLSPTRLKPIYVRGQGAIEAPLACFQMLGQSFQVPFQRETIRRILEQQLKTSDRVSLTACGAISEIMGLRAQLVQIPVNKLSRIKPPALIQWQDSFAVIYRVSEQQLLLAVPEVGILRHSPQEFATLWGETGSVLLLQPSPAARQEKFSLRWFLPALKRHRRVLMEVFIASFFVQLFGLANPLITQMIIDKVLVQHSLDTLHVLGVLLLGVAIFEALLTSLRTYLFTDTTNRIDLSLGSEVIDHLLRLPLTFFDRRRVGELAGRLNELEQIRQFLTGTALTVVLDAVFSVVYIAVMWIYSWQLTLVALAIVPAFAMLTVFVSPLIRQQFRHKAERYADTQALLVEVLSGMQTVKAQNIELRSRWQWQERYSRYISAGFKGILTSSNANAIGGFLNKLSGLLVLWVGASLVLSNQLSLGQLIAFRLIAGYVTSPLMRLLQLWQNFQETALSIERLSDVLNAAPESDETDRRNIPMPAIQGNVKFEEISFGFHRDRPLQLRNIHCEFPAGTCVGIVGQSGSGKSTLTKLLQRLYEPTAGRIQIDGYDIHKVELYSLRRQIGVVLQDTLLFNGTVQENIALTNPDASPEQIIEAAKLALAHDFIMSLPDGYNTIVGERGSALSGGQRQRIAIARTILQNPRLLILDEATSALDSQTEQQVCQNLSAAFRDRTLFVVTHRFSTVKHADVILVMDQGAIVEQGSHSELMALKGRYYCLSQQQANPAH